MTLSLGQVAPDFTLPDQEGKMHTLSNYRGQFVLIYFYPKDDTPGCTKEACMLRDHFLQFQSLKVKVFGISTDSVKSHAKFAEKYKLPFTLLADEEKKVVEAYGVYPGINRESFLVNPEGKIAKIYEKVKPEEHAQEVLRDLTVI